MSSARRIAGELTGIISAAATWPSAACKSDRQTHLKGWRGFYQNDLPGCGKSMRAIKEKVSLWNETHPKWSRQTYGAREGLPRNPLPIWGWSSCLQLNLCELLDQSLEAMLGFPAQVCITLFRTWVCFKSWNKNLPFGADSLHIFLFVQWKLNKLYVTWCL